MCGIAGAVSARTPPEALARAMIATLRRRGPDGEGLWAADGAAFGQARLAVIDLTEAGAQPMVSADGRYVINFNGEIYNAENLRRRLDAEGPTIAWRGRSDTEVFLEWIARHGVVSALEASAGMFAFAVWDRVQRRLTLARDRAGEKPLYYGWAGEALVFASELKALRVAPGFDPAVDPAAETAFAARGHVLAPLTIYRAARKLPAGSWLTWTPSDGRAWPTPVRWWSIETVAARGAADPITDPEAADAALEDVLGRAVERQMISDVPLGAFLSGGIDSSLIVALMQARSPRPIKTFTVAFDEAAFDESGHAAAVADHLGTEHHALRVSSDQARAVVPTLADMYDEPFADASQIPTSLIAALARRQVTVALSGDGGDELFGGYNRHRLLPRIRRTLGPWPRPLRQGAAGLLRHAPLGLVERLATGAGASASVARRIDDLAAMLDAADDPRALYAAALRVWPGAIAPDAPSSDEGDYARWMMLADYLSYLPDDVLTKVDRAAMYHSLETRCPYLDPDVAVLAWRLPMALKLSGGVGKRPLRRLLDKYAPAALTDRPKAGFTPPIGDWIRGPLADWAEHLLAPESLAGQAAFDPTTVQRLWRAHRAGRADHGRRLWPVLIYGAWRERWGTA